MVLLLHGPFLVSAGAVDTRRLYIAHAARYAFREMKCICTLLLCFAVQNQMSSDPVTRLILFGAIRISVWRRRRALCTKKGKLLAWARQHQADV